MTAGVEPATLGSRDNQPPSALAKPSNFVEGFCRPLSGTGAWDNQPIRLALGTKSDLGLRRVCATGAFAHCRRFEPVQT